MKTLHFQPNVNLEGNVAIGADSAGNDAACNNCGAYDSEQLGHIEPDPLGVSGGTLATRFAAAAARQRQVHWYRKSTVRAYYSPTAGTTVIPSGEYSPVRDQI